jgi:hypothetical protein
MGIGPLVSLAGGYIQSLITGAVKGSSSTSASATSSAVSSSMRDTNQLSPFAQILGSLQQLQQSNPSQYKDVTQQIASNLQTAAQSATASGNTALASQLTQLSTDFKTASSTGQLPNVQDLAQAVGGGHHHHHYHGGGSSGTGPTPPDASSQTSADPNNPLNPLSIISNTLTNAGVPIG